MAQENEKRRKKRTKKRSAISKVGLFLLDFVTCASGTWNYCIGRVAVDEPQRSEQAFPKKQEAVPELMQQAESASGKRDDTGGGKYPVSWKGLYLQKGYSDLFVFRN